MERKILMHKLTQPTEARKVNEKINQIHLQQKGGDASGVNISVVEKQCSAN